MEGFALGRASFEKVEGGQMGATFPIERSEIGGVSTGSRLLLSFSQAQPEPSDVVLMPLSQ